MPLELLRLAVGMPLLIFHRPIADFMLRQEDVLVGLFRSRGVSLPAFSDRDLVRNLYFGLGAAIALITMARIWMQL